MLFNSFEFLFVFLPITLSLFYCLGKYERTKIALIWLTCASLFYYGWWEPIYVLFILGSILFNYSLGVFLCHSHQKRKEKTKRKLLTFGVVSNLGGLGYFKYANFLIENINTSLNLNFQFSEVALPLAISFFTFQQIAYLVDVSRGEIQESKFRHYCIFVVFFPQLIAGPIVYHKEMLPQFSRSSMFPPQAKNLAVGLTILFLGLFKKVIIADEMAIYASPIFYASAQGVVLTFFQSWFGALAYTFQIYFDYSGYSDIAIGVAWMFGLRLPLNFFSPYKAVNIIEFWRRWNMTLSRFLRDYLYVPLGGNRGGHFRTFINLMITMVLGGLWHGANWNFIIWGGIHGLFLTINHAWHIIKNSLNCRFYQYALVKAISHLFTFLAVTVAWVFFRAENFSSAKNILASMFGLNSISLPRGLKGKLGNVEPILTDIGFTFEGMTQGLFYNLHEFYGFLLLCIFIVFFCPNVYQIMGKFQPALISGAPPENLCSPQRIAWEPSLAWAFAMATITTFAILGLNQVSEFLYFQF